MFFFYFVSIIIMVIVEVGLPSIVGQNNDIAEYSLRLVGGSTRYEGGVEIYHAGEWSSVCSSFLSNEDGLVICRQLGYFGVDDVFIDAHFGEGSGTIYLGGFYCTGYESELAECLYYHWGFPNCDHSEDIGVRCLAAGFVKGDLRLRGGMGIHEGFVEIYHGIWGRWGAIVDNHFGANEARTVCNQLGFTGGAVEYYDGDAPFELDFYERDDDIFAWTNSVDCDGSEGRLIGCNIVFHAYEVPADQLNGVVCDVDESSIYRGKLRLVDGEDFTHGRVEIYLEDKWGTICNDDFLYGEGYVVCRSLGFPDVESYGKESIPSGIDNIYLEHLDCDGSESSVLYCEARQIHNYNCGNSGEVVVRCSRPAADDESLQVGLIAGVAAGTFLGIFLLSSFIKMCKKSNASSGRVAAGNPATEATNITVHKYVNSQGVQQPFQPSPDPTGSQPHSGSYPASVSHGMQGMQHPGGHSGNAAGGHSQGYPGPPVVPQELSTSTATYYPAPSWGSPAHQSLGLPPQGSVRPVSPGFHDTMNPPAFSQDVVSYDVPTGSPPVYTAQPAAVPQVYTITQHTNYP